MDVCMDEWMDGYSISSGTGMVDDLMNGVGGENRKTQLVNNASDDDDEKRPRTDLPRGDTPLA